DTSNGVQLTSHINPNHAQGMEIDNALDDGSPAAEGDDGSEDAEGDDEMVVDSQEKVINEGADIEGDGQDVVVEGGSGVDSANVQIGEEIVAGADSLEEGENEIDVDVQPEDGDYVEEDDVEEDDVEEEEDADSVISLSEEGLLIEEPVNKSLEGLIVMDELPDNTKDKRKKVAKVPVRGDEVLKLENLTKAQRAAYEEAGKEAIDEFLRHPNTTSIDTHLRRYIRENQCFMPIASSKTRKLALHVLTSNCGNVMCLYHHVIEKSGYIINGEGDYRINGVPRPRNVNRVITDGVKRLKGYLHCGCSEDVALLDFYFWKTWSLSSELPDGTRVTETLKDQMLEPRICGFVVDQFQNWTGLTIEDIYQGNQRKSEHALDVYQVQIEHVLTRMNRVAKKVEGKRYLLSVEDVE
ncbi:hypothetical protein H0H92_005848, partial [Tricholoma furcatifolium]